MLNTSYGFNFKQPGIFLPVKIVEQKVINIKTSFLKLFL